jgi:hypothetical protein
MFPIHVVMGQPKSWWLDYVPCITAFAALITVCVAFWIAQKQMELQKELAKRQFDIQTRQLTKDLFDRRFAVFTAVDSFIAYVVQNNGKIQLAGPGEYRQWREAMERAQMLFGEDVNEYLKRVEQTAGEFYVAVHKLENNRADMEAIDDNERLLNELSVALPAKRVQVFRPYLELFHKG